LPSLYEQLRHVSQAVIRVVTVWHAGVLRSLAGAKRAALSIGGHKRGAPAHAEVLNPTAGRWLKARRNLAQKPFPPSNTDGLRREPTVAVTGFLGRGGERAERHKRLPVGTGDFSGDSDYDFFSQGRHRPEYQSISPSK
jgi:hypothetical protein